MTPLPRDSSLPFLPRAIALLSMLLFCPHAVAVEDGEGGDATEARDALLGEGYRALDSGEFDRALAIFQSLIEDEPDDLEAREGLVWTYLRSGRLEAAALAADERLALSPEDADWYRSWLTVMAIVPSRRDEAIAGYRELLATAPGDRGARLGLAQVLSWEGRRDEAHMLFDGLIAEDPEDLEARLGRARSARRERDWETARRHYDRGIELAPHDARFAIERVQLEIEPALMAARVAMSEHRARTPAQPAQDDGPLESEVVETEVREAGVADGEVLLDEESDAGPRARVMTSPAVGAHPAFSHDSAGLTRWDVMLGGDIMLARTQLGARAGWSRFSDGMERLDRLTFGGQLRQTLPLGFYLGGTYLARLHRGAPNVNEWNAEAGLESSAWPVSFHAGFWQHSIVDTVRSRADIASLEEVGVGGMTLDSLRQDVQVRDGSLVLSVSPFQGTYAYGSGEYGVLSDDNRRAAAGAGIGVDLLNPDEPPSRHELRLKYDYYFLTFEEDRAEYWTPADFQVHTPGLLWTWRPSVRWTAGAESGAPIDPQDGSVGYLIGAFVRCVTSGPWVLQARIRMVDDTEFAIVAGTLGLIYAP